MRAHAPLPQAALTHQRPKVPSRTSKAASDGFPGEIGNPNIWALGLNLLIFKLELILKTF